MTESAAQVALPSDLPVAGFDSLAGLAATRLRRRPFSAQAPNDDKRLSALDAPRGYTTWAGAAVGKQSALTVGARADPTNFGVDPVECPADDWWTTRF